MPRPITSKSRKMPRLMVLAVVAGLTAVTVAEQAIVKSEVNIKADKNPFADAVETVPSDTQLQVLSHDGDWLKVRTPSGKEGYISEADLPPKADLASIQGTGGSSGPSNDAALRGLQDDAEHYAKGHNYSTAGVEQMIAWGRSISDNDLKAFADAGHVGPKKYRH